ncbi:probable peroxygenase 5 [Cicer arietinum]|uniref:Probable peroxygenase 5 n=1 Tax=Cicer arietinum TaxID=3827 RepID=A0A1S2XM79_CICAR|nr:probable peroxygenase 5 [Cicer arietinum]
MNTMNSFQIRLPLLISFFYIFLAIATAQNSSGLSVLQKHVSFFDRNHDGIIYPKETFEGFRAIGCGVALSTTASAFIHAGLSQKTRPGKAPSPLLPIEIVNIKLSIHGSDSGVYDSEGGFVASKFEEIFSKHAKQHPNALTSDELKEMLTANREPKDFKGWLAAESEWKILYDLCKDKEGLLQKDIVYSVYDGSLFERLEKEHSKTKNNK